MLTRVNYFNHHPILISFEDASFNMHNKSFKLECAWMLDGTYGYMIEEAWNDKVDLMHNLHSIKITATNWNMINVKGM